MVQYRVIGLLLLVELLREVNARFLEVLEGLLYSLQGSRFKGRDPPLSGESSGPTGYLLDLLE